MWYQIQMRKDWRRTLPVQDKVALTVGYAYRTVRLIRIENQNWIWKGGWPVAFTSALRKQREQSGAIRTTSRLSGVGFFLRAPIVTVMFICTQSVFGAYSSDWPASPHLLLPVVAERLHAKVYSLHLYMRLCVREIGKDAFSSHIYR